jgi:hypothetical protein
MPHFGLMDPDALGAEAASLQRARLHIRGGRRRLRQGKISAGLGTLYDALLFALDWYVASPDRRKNLPIQAEDNLRDDRTLFALLVKAGVIDGRFEYGALRDLVHTAPPESSAFEYGEILNQVESVMLRLGVLPFDENDLPPEDPSTY